MCTDSDLKKCQPITDVLGSLVENVVLLHKEHPRRHRLAVLPEEGTRLKHAGRTSTILFLVELRLGAAVLRTDSGSPAARFC